jgi:hypothetical protein
MGDARIPHGRHIGGTRLSARALSIPMTDAGVDGSAVDTASLHEK